jgi:hypothetical protein
MKPVLLVVTIFLLLVALLHLTRLVLQVEVIVSGTTIPLWISVFGTIVPASMAVLLWRENKTN